MRATTVSLLLLLSACVGAGSTPSLHSARPLSLPSGEGHPERSRARAEAAPLPPAARFSQAFEATNGGRPASPSAVAATPDGGVVVALNFSGETRVERRHFHPLGGSDGVVVALRPDGRVRWARVIGGSGNDGILAVAVGEDGRVAVAGVISGSVELNRQVHTGGTRFFLATFDADGAPMGFTQALSTSHGWSQINDLTFTTGGELVAVGSFNGQLDISGASSFHAGYWNGFVVRFDARGRFSRGARTLRSRDASLLRVAPTSDGGFVAAGRYRRRVLTGVNHHHGAGGDDTLLIRYDAEGEPVWSRSFGRSTDDVPHSLAVRSSGEVIVGMVRSGHDRAHRGAPPDASFVYAFTPEGELGWWRRLTRGAVDLAGPRGAIAEGTPAVFGWVDGEGLLGLARFDSGGAAERRLRGQLFGGHLGNSIALTSQQAGHIFLLGAGVGRASDGRRVTQGVEVVAMPLASGGSEVGLWLEEVPLASR